MELEKSSPGSDLLSKLPMQDLVSTLDPFGSTLDPFGSRRASRQFSEPVRPSDPKIATCPNPRSPSRQFSEPVRRVSDFEDLDPRVAALCRQVSEGVAHIPFPLAPGMLPLRPLPRMPHTSEEVDEDLASSGGSESDAPLLGSQDDECALTCLLSPEDGFPVLAICCFMSLAQGTCMCSFFGAIGFFSFRLGSPQLILYTTIAQAILTPVVLDLQRRYDHVFDARLGHRVTFLFRIVGLSTLQVLCLLIVPCMSTPSLFLILACLSGAITVMVFAQCCLVISCTDGTQAVNFARTACHAGGVVVLLLSRAFGVSTRSSLSTIFGFFASVAALQAIAVIAWYLEHRKNKSLSAAYAVIAAQQSYSAGEAARDATATAAGDGVAAAEGDGVATFATMFGNRHRSTGIVLLCSFSIVWVAWSFIQSVMNMFGGENLTQWLVLLSYPADTSGRVLSHILHSLKGAAVPSNLCHGLTFVAVFMSMVLLVDTCFHFLDLRVLGIVMFALCSITTFAMNELAVKTMEVAKSRPQVAHCQNYAFFAANGVAKLGALLFQFACGTA